MLTFFQQTFRLRSTAPLILLVMTGALAASPARATAVFACVAADQNIPALTLEGHIPYTGDQIVDMRGEVELEAGKTIAFDKADVKKFMWKKTISLDVKKQIAPGTLLEIEIRTRAGEDETTFPGTYKVRAGKQKFEGKADCSGG